MSLRLLRPARAGIAIALCALPACALWVHLDAVLAWLDARDIVLVEPRALWLAALVPVVWVGRVFAFTDLPRAQQWLQAALRTALILLVVGAVSRPERRESKARHAHTVYVVDVSESVPDGLLQEAQRSLDEAWRLRGDNGVSLVTFADKASRIDAPAPPEGEPDAVRPAPRVGRHGAGAGLESDLESALALGLSLLPADAVPRVVIASDGKETRGQARSLIELAKGQGVRFDIVSPERFATAPELVLRGIDLPSSLKVNVPFETVARIFSSVPGSVGCTLDVDGKASEKVSVDVGAGESRIPLTRTRFKDGGVHALSARCEAESGADRFATNNAIALRVFVPDKPRVLYVEGERGQERYLARALDDDFHVELRGAAGIPHTIEDLKRYAAVVISDVPRVAASGKALMSLGQMKLLDEYARQGGGLLFAGGENSFGPGGYQDTYIEREVLPVRLGTDQKTEAPTLALVLCIDRSGSMTGKKIELAKEAARAAAGMLNPDDKIAVIAFDSQATMLVPPTRAGNRFRIASDIGRLTAGGGTHIYPALDAAHKTLTGIEAKVKHVILLTDGQAQRAGIDDLVRRMARSLITVTTVGVGTEIDRPMLQDIAEAGGGRVYFTDRPETLPRLFMQETSQVARRSMVERDFRPLVNPPYARLELLKGVDLKAAPALLGYTSTKPKAGAEVILASPEGEPVLARWRRGVGKVAVWTSDIKNKWAHFWINWTGYPVLMRQLVRDLLKDERSRTVEPSLALERGRLRLSVDAVGEDDRYLSGIHASAVLRSPDGQERSVALAERVAGHYEAVVPLAGWGAYEARVELRGKPGDEPFARGVATAVAPYPDELALTSGPDVALLEVLRMETHGRRDPTPQDLHDVGQARVTSYVPAWPPLVWLALALVALDVALRRVRFGRAAELPWA